MRPRHFAQSENWLKIKTVQKGKFPVIGFVEDPTGVAALYLGKKEGKDLVYMGIHLPHRSGCRSNLPEERQKLFREFSPAFLDLIVIDECHRGSAAEDSAWREILEYFSSAAQIGLTATAEGNQIRFQHRRSSVAPDWGRIALPH
jgi:hypothetical protein